MGDTLHGGSASTDDAYPLVRKPGHGPAGRVAAGVVVVPAAGVEAVPLEGLDPRDTWQLRSMQRPSAHRDMAGPNPIVSVGLDQPPRRFLIPFEAGDFG